MEEKKPQPLNHVAEIVKLATIVVGIVISILSFNETRRKDADARIAEAEKEQVEAAKPFIEARQELYTKALKAVEVTVNPSLHDPADVKKATERFWDLYWGELCIVESKQVEAAMIAFGNANTVQDRKDRAYDLAHAMRDSIIESWGIRDKEKVGPINQ